MPAEATAAEENPTQPAEEWVNPSVQTEETYAAETGAELPDATQMPPQGYSDEGSDFEAGISEESQPEGFDSKEFNSEPPKPADPDPEEANTEEAGHGELILTNGEYPLNPEETTCDSVAQEDMQQDETGMMLQPETDSPAEQQEIAEAIEENSIESETTEQLAEETSAPETEVMAEGETAAQIAEGTSAAEETESTELPVGSADDILQEEPANSLWITIAFFASAFLLAGDVVLICIISAEIRKLSALIQTDTESYKVTEHNTVCSNGVSGVPAVGRAHNIGMRNYQQDSFGQIPVLNNQGILAVVADGMGGLSDGEKVSQRIVMKALDFGVKIANTPNADTLVSMVNIINTDVNQMLGEENLFKSGSTLVATLIVKDTLWWASVGDSRIYLYRNGYLNQLTRDHDLLQEWMNEVSQGRMTYDQVRSNPDGRKLTSFIGMGKLRYIGYNSTPISLYPGDRILLMSDGVYGTVSTDEMAHILKACPDVQEAADAVSRKIENTKRRHQDNYTIMILGI